jgi:hypothetical protein
MAQGGEKPAFEQPAAKPEGAVETPESGAVFETPSASADEKPAEGAPSALPAATASVVSAPIKDEAMREVENLLEEGLSDVYTSLDEAHKRRFKAEGEKVALRLAEMVRGAKVRAREVLALLTKWLKIIPGVNAFFLEQEAKLKTDKILALIEEEKRKRSDL